MKQRIIKISAIMACYNSSAYLDEAVSSVLGQTLGDLELILIDDCSTDNTLEIAKRYQVQDQRVSVLSLPVNSGPATARNAGIQVAKGEWLGIIDSDDIATPSRFEEQMRLADSDIDLVIIGSNSISIDKKGRAIKKHTYPTGHQKLVNRLYSRRAFPSHSSMVYRRDVVEKLSAFNPRYVPSEDYDLWLRLSEVGKVASIDKTLVKIRKHKQNISYSEGGLISARSASAATICHFLRSHGCADPSVGKDESCWQEFLTWVERRMIEEGVLEAIGARANARAKYFTTDNGLIGAFRYVNHIVRSDYAFTIVWEKIFGSSLPKRLALEWRKRFCVPSQASP